MQAQVVLLASREAEDGAERGVTRAAVANGLPMDAILLGGEGQQGGESSNKQVIHRAGEDVQAAVVNPQTKVLEAEEIVVDSFGGTRVLAGVEQKVKGNHDTIGSSIGQGGADQVRHLEGAMNHLQEGERFDPCRRGVRLALMGRPRAPRTTMSLKLASVTGLAIRVWATAVVAFVSAEMPLDTLAPPPPAVVVGAVETVPALVWANGGSHGCHNVS